MFVWHVVCCVLCETREFDECQMLKQAIKQMKKSSLCVIRVLCKYSVFDVFAAAAAAANLLFIFARHPLWNYSDCCFSLCPQSLGNIKYFLATFIMADNIYIYAEKFWIFKCCWREMNVCPKFPLKCFLCACIQFMSAFLWENLCFIFDIYLTTDIL